MNEPARGTSAIRLVLLATGGGSLNVMPDDCGDFSHHVSARAAISGSLRPGGGAGARAAPKKARKRPGLESRGEKGCKS